MTSQVSAQTVKHTVKSGDTLYEIALENSIKTEKLRQANGLKKGEVLKIGRILTIPTGKHPSEKSISTYKVKKGDALSLIAQKYGTDVKTLKSLNHLKSDVLRAGSTIKVPGIGAKEKKSIQTATYRIKSGDALYTVAKKYGTDVKTLQKINKMKGTRITAGQTIKVPAAGGTKTYQAKKQKSSKNFVASISSNPAVTKGEKSSWNPLEKFFSAKKTDQPKSKKIIEVAKTKLGNKYVWGAVGTKGTFDCSGFTKYCYKKNGIEIPRTSIMQSKYGKFVKRSELKKGDLIFFDTSKRRKGYVNHVGIYMGDNKFIHASSAGKKVIITSLKKPFYSQRYMGARRPS
ncbi:MAG: LysM peptidoglycan-binding domain-containing protein [Sulfurimonas sp.]